MGKPVLSSELQRQVHGSVLVDSSCKLEALASLLERPADSLRLDLLFSTGESGWRSPHAFHEACDGKGSTFTLIKASHGSAFGGYTSINWNSSNTDHADAHAFLFRIVNFSKTHSKLLPEKFCGSGEGNDIYDSSQYGPIFGSGNDLTTFSSSGIIMNSRGQSYCISGPLFNASLPKGPSSFRLEVLQVGGLSPSLTRELHDPWMTNCIWTKEVHTPAQKSNVATVC